MLAGRGKKNRNFHVLCIVLNLINDFLSGIHFVPVPVSTKNTLKWCLCCTWFEVDIFVILPWFFVSITSIDVPDRGEYCKFHHGTILYYFFGQQYDICRYHKATTWFWFDSTQAACDWYEMMSYTHFWICSGALGWLEFGKVHVVA